MRSSTPFTDWLDSAGTAARAGDANAAKSAIDAALASGEGSYDGLLSLSRLAWDMEAYAQSVAASNAADRIDPQDHRFQAIRQAMGHNDMARAGSLAQAMLADQPGHPKAHYTLAHIARANRQVPDARAHIEAGLKTAPGNMILRHMEVGALEDAGDDLLALEAARRLPGLARTPDSILELGRVLMRHGLNAELLALYDGASDVSFSRDQRGGMHLVRGHALRVVGQRDAAVAAYHASIETRTAASLEAWWALSDLTTYRFSDTELAQLQAIVSDPSIPPRLRCQPAFGLAKAVETRSGLATALPIYHQANALYDASGFDADRFEDGVSRIADRVDREALATRAPMTSYDASEARPIFILGMPRSGSTLLEQILASHSQIEGTHELTALPAVKQSLHQYCVDRLGGSYLDRLGAIPVERLVEAGQDYLKQTRLFRHEDRPFFIDKLPHNFEHVGLIHKILPQAVIIDMRRHPMACGLSLYRQYFASGWPWAYDLTRIGRYYAGYARLMQHWDRVLPEGTVLHLRYERLVSDMGASVQRVLAHVGVPFEADCLTFHENQRAVRTPSSEQVRQPIYTKSVESWREVAAELAPLRAALGESLIQNYERSLSQGHD